MSEATYAIVGASLTGATAAATLRREGFEGRILLAGAELELPYERPQLSKKYLRDEIHFEDILVESEGFYAQNGIDLRLGTTVAGIERAPRALVTASGERIEFDRLLIATGARNRRLPIPGLDLDGVYDLRTVGDAERIKAEIAPGRRVVLAGMGFIGSEVAASLRQRGLEVTAVDGGTVPLERVLGEKVGGVLEGIHRDHGVRMIFGDYVSAFEGEKRVRRLITKGGLSLECDLAVVGFGVEPVTEFLAGSDVEVADGVVVDEYCRSSLEDVYAAGDVANHYNPVFGRRLRVEHWQNAMKHGRAAALNMLDRDVSYDEAYWFWSDQYEHNIQYGGHHVTWDALVVRGSIEDRSFTAFYMDGGVVRAAVSVDRQHDVIRALPLIKAGRPIDPNSLGDESLDLRTLIPVRSA